MAAPPETTGEGDAQAPLAAALRLTLLAMVGGLAIASAANFAFGRLPTAIAAALGAALGAVALRYVAPKRVDLVATLTFFGLIAILLGLVYVGHGTRDYGLVAITGIVFAGSLFLRPRPYWTVATILLTLVLLLGVAEMEGWYVPRPIPATGPREILNLVLIVAASAFCGRGIMYAIRSALERERKLSGALESSEDRMRKFFRSSPNPTSMSRLQDGKYIEVNEAYLEQFGYSAEELRDRTALDIGLWADPEDRARFAQVIRERGVVRDYSTRMRKRNGEICEMQIAGELADINGETCLLASMVDVTLRRQAEMRAEQLATRDALTGLPNRVAALDRAQHALQRAIATGRHLAVMHVDIDRFKAINDSFGYAAGDALLREVASRLQEAMVSGDTLARVAGDEFLVIAESIGGPEDAKALAERFVPGAFKEPFQVAGQEVRVSASAGLSIGPDYAIDADRLLRRADTAMHLAKSDGRGRCRTYDQRTSERVRDRLFIEACLRTAVPKGQLRLVYQPKLALADGRLTGLEALARWKHPDLGEVAPSVFIPIAEESGLIHDVGEWVLREACVQLSRWREQGLQCVPVAVNLSAPQFTPELPRLVADAIQAHGLAPELIELEVTESLLIKNPEGARRLLQQVSARGSSIMLDDFGVGYSSLSYIKQLDIDGIKIDRSFVRDLVGSKHDGAIVRAIVGLAHGLGLRVVGEGVEFEAQARALRELGCDEGQGFYFSRPLPGEEIGARFLPVTSRAARAVG